MYFVGANKYHDHKSEVYGKYDFASVNLKVFWVHKLLNTHFCDKILTVSSTWGRRGSKAIILSTSLQSKCRRLAFVVNVHL